MRLLRMCLGQTPFTAHWIVSLLAGHLPIQHWIIRDFCRSWNRVDKLRGSNSLIKHALLMQMRMLRSKQPCWLKSWHDAFQRIVQDDLVTLHLRCVQGVHEEHLVHCLQRQYSQLLLGMGDPTHPECPHRRIAFTHHIIQGLQFQFVQQPQSVKWHMPQHVRVSWLSFLAANAPLQVHSYRLAGAPYTHRMCRKCTRGNVGDETHVLLKCPSTSSVRRGF